MTDRATPALHAAVRFSWERLDFLVLNMCASLGLGRVRGLPDVRPFLPRWQLATLRRFLAHAEPLLRRLLVLMAAELGALPAARKPADGPQVATPAAGTAGPGKRPLFPVPRFRLSEPAAPSAPRTPPPTRYRTGPRIRRLDVDTPVDLSDYPALDTDLLPAARHVRRLQALGHVFANFDDYLTAMRRRLAGPARVIARALPPALDRRPLTPGERATARLIHDAAVASCPDTS